MQDWKLIITILKDGRWHHIQEIIQRIAPFSRNKAVRSRIADIKKKVAGEGLTIEARIAHDRQAEYRLVFAGPTDQPRAAVQQEFL